MFEGLGELPGEYKIITDKRVKLKVHPTRRVPVAVRPKIKEKLGELVQRNVITPVTEPTEWVSSMLAVIKAEQNLNLFGPKGSERSDQARALPDAYHRRGRYSTGQSKAFHSGGRKRRILAEETRPRVKLQNDIQHSLRTLPLASHALWYQFRSRSMAKNHAQIQGFKA